MKNISRRDCLKVAAGSLAGGMVLSTGCGERDTQQSDGGATKSVAAVMTVYRPGSHADVLVGKILEGWKQDGGPGPALKLASMYVDQFPDNDMARAMGRKYGVPIFDSIEQAVTVGGDRVAVDGVLSIGEHGEYPRNALLQDLYPRRAFFEEISDTFEKYNRVVPVFSDKHLGPVWADALWMVERARELKIPLMAGSSLPVAYRRPVVELPLGAPIEAAVGVCYYKELDKNGIHALESYQCLVERRAAAEQGVRSVQFLQGPDIWKAVERGAVDREVLDAADALLRKAPIAGVRESEQSVLMLFEYVDGLRGAQFLFPVSDEVPITIAVGLKLKQQSEPVAIEFEMRTEPRYPHFAYLLKAIETMIHTGVPSYPVERTLLTSGILDRALTSRAAGGKRLETPELGIAYQPVDYPHAPKPDLLGVSENSGDPSGH